jgi:diguanylate cyclase (GGDEF)-like protein
MYDWKSQFTVQRQDYLKRTSERLASMEEMLSAIPNSPGDLAPLRDLAQHFHQLAGSSAIYEMDKLGDLASQGEKVCLKVLREQEQISKADWKSMRDMVESMKFMISQHPDTVGGGVAAGAGANGGGVADGGMHTSGGFAQTTGGFAQTTGGFGHTTGGFGGTNGGGGPWQTVTAENAALAWPSSFNEQRSSGGWLVGNVQYAGPNAFQKAKDIVVVDGDQANLLTVTRALETAGMQVRGYRTTETAKKALHDRLPDALILSIPLIDGPGYDVAQELRSLPDGTIPPILIVSRQIGFLDKVMAIRSGADAFFNELSDTSVIVKKLQSLFERDKPENYTILSVEDDPDQVVIIRSILESVGYNVHSISDPRQFEEALLATNPDLILLDVMLGPMSGFELARYVRSDDRYAATPIIFLTTQNQLNAHVESARVGGDEHLIKPVAPQLLIAAVTGRLERYRILRNLIGRDGLTGFLTMASFMEAAEKLLSKRYQGSGSMVLLMIDIDDMEILNDRFGYAAGDRVISTLSKQLKQKLRNAEAFGRLGADDFAVIVDGVDDRELAEVATQIIRDFESTVHEVNGNQFKATISAGAAALETDMSLKSWMNNAQIALKSAKSNGKNRVMKAKTRSTRY